MAPPIGPRGGPQRTGGRSSRGGGISKRRHNPLKTDRDGDVPMDAPAAGRSGSGPGARGSRDGRGGRGLSRGSTRVSSRVAQNLRNYAGDGTVASKAQFNRTTLKILGLRSSKVADKPDGGLRTLLDFLERKASKEKQITIGKSILDGDYVWISVHKDDAQNILHLNGFVFTGAPLTITETSERMPNKEEQISKEAAETKQKLTAVVAKRYDPEQKFLDLSALGSDDILSSMGTFDSQNLAEKAFKALVHLASSSYKNSDEKRQALQAVSLARNNLNDVDQVFSLAHSLPDLRRLDLSGNNLDSLSKVAKWKYRFRYLEELHLTGNPMVTQENYVVELLQWFPSLQNLNGQQVRTPEQVAQGLRALEPTPLPQFPSNLRDGDANVATIFLQNFFPMFDTDRARLVSEFYDEDSWFSLAAVPNAGRPLAWRSYLKFSRNIQRFGGAGRNPGLMQRLFTGNNLIADMWKALPVTRHPGMDQPGQWLVDCHTFPNLADPSGHGSAMGLIICVNGQFEEADASANLFGTRTFSRTFILGPSKPFPPPKHPYRVISDQLTLHDWKPQAEAAVQAPVVAPLGNPIINPVINPVIAPVPTIAPVVSDEVLKSQMIQELSNRTGMTAEYSMLCLSGAANWNFDLALKSFEETRASLPPQAFIAAV